MKEIIHKIKFLVLSILFASQSYSQTHSGAISLQAESIAINSKKAIIANVLDLPIPTMIYPSNGTTNIPIIPVFSFSTVQDADRYDLELSFDPYFSQIITSSYRRFASPTRANDTLYIAPGITSPNNFKGGTVYYWRVKASMFDGSNSSLWSQPYSYTTKTSGFSLLRPNLIIPGYGSTISWIDVPLVWSIVSEATNYQVQYSTDINFNGFTYWYTYGTQSSINAFLKPYQTYYWRVIGINENSLSPFSITNKFYTGDQAALTKSQDTFDDGSGLDNYNNNMDLYWLIHPTDAKQIALSFSSLKTEQDYDFVTIYDGPTTGFPVLGKFSGNTISGPVISSSNNMLVRFKTDAYVNDSGWNASYYSIPGNKLYPALIISSGSVSAGDVISASSQNMTPNGVVNFTLSGSDTSIVSSVLADYQGNASTSFSVSQNAVEGIYEINATDVTSSRSSPPKYFYVTQAKSGPNINWSFPIADTISAGSDFQIQWKDQMIKNSRYQINGSTRQYSYNVDISNDRGLNWNPLKTINGGGRIYDWINITTVLSIQNTGNYIIRVVDNNVMTRILTSNEFHVVLPAMSYVKLGLTWDYSYQQSSNSPPIGVAADGVSRIYLTISSTKSISQIKVSLSDDDGNTGAKKLGKIMNAVVTSQFSDEANNASQTTSTILSPNHESQYWFWYVAPNDFVGNNQLNKYEAERTVSANFQVSFSDGSIGTKRIPIKIVRPPLLLIHGLGGSSSTWDNFQYNNLGFQQRFINDFRFPLVSAPSITNNSGFDLGSLWVKNRCVQLILKLREMGYASSQIIYIGHSMGGNYLRALAESLGYSVSQNYFRGYINKAILLDSPSNGSPLADFLDVIVDIINVTKSAKLIFEAYYLMHSNMFVEGFTSSIFKSSGNWPFLGVLSTSDAVRDLNAGGGYKFEQTNIPSHLIGGVLFKDLNDFNNVTSDELEKIAESNEWFNVLDRIADILLIAYPQIELSVHGIEQSQKRNLLIVDAALKLITGISIFNGDLVVPLESQIAGLGEDVSNVTVFNRMIHSGDNKYSVTSRIDVGNVANELLDTDTQELKFGNIPSNYRSSNTILAKNQSYNSQILFGIKKNNIKLNSLTDSTNVFVDSTMNISFNIQDTAGLKYVKLFFQNKSYLSYDKSFNQGFTLQVSGTYLHAQPLEILSVYNKNDSTYWSYNNSIINVQTSSPLQKFFIEPKVIEIASNQLYSPDYNAVYSSFLSRIQSNNPDLKFNISDPNIVSLSSGTNFIKGISKGETSVIISYKGLADTLYIIVGESIATGIKENNNNETIPDNFYLSQNYPNPFNPTTFIEFSVPRTELVKLKVYDILGREIKTLVNEIKQVGNYRVEFNAKYLASGVYFYRIQAGSFSDTKKFILMK